MTWRKWITLRPHVPSVVTTLICLAILGAVAGGSVVLLGLYNVSAKAGHLPGVKWALHTTFRNSVDLRAHLEPPEDLDSEAMVALGAGHFDTACRRCHASPGTRRSATVHEMVPKPPHLDEIAAKDWTASELHWIVREGVKMSGMPGWPARRDDDVWPVVAFLRAAGDMDAARYAELTERPEGPEGPEGQFCAMCHGATGRSDNPQIPRLDILSETYIRGALEAYRDGQRDSGIMAQAISRVPEGAIPRLAGEFAGHAPTDAAEPMGDLEQRGQALATRSGTRKVPACRACHGPWPERLNPAFPSLAGQYEPYLRQQLELWREGKRGGSRVAELMHHAAENLTDEDIAALAAYYAALAPATLNDTAE